MWECKQWTAERWNTTQGRVQSACWSPCASILLFVTSEETILYSLSSKLNSAVFAHNASLSPDMATPVLDLSRIELPNGQIIGGLVQAMDWDKKGRHLAMLFKDTNVVAVFTTSVLPVLHVTPA